jgi:PKD repeat protein
MPFFLWRWKMLRALLTTVVSLLVCLAWGKPDLRGEETSGPPTIFVVLIDKSGSMDHPFPAPIQARLSDVTKLQDVRRRLGLLADHLPENSHVIVIAFDHEAQRLYSERLDSDAERKKLREVFAAIESRGGSTYLWRTLDSSLAMAKSLIEQQPGRRVRLLLYTDGIDEERRPGLDHQSIVRKYRNWLQSSVELDWITIGFDVGEDVQKELSEAGVRITKADTPDDLEPLIARFGLSARELPVAAELRLTDTSIGTSIVERFIDWGDGSPHVKTEGTASHRYTRPGEYSVRYAVRTASGRIDHCSETVVVLPPAPTAKFRLASSEAGVARKMIVLNDSSSTMERCEWRINGKVISTARNLEWVPQSAEPMLVRLTVWDRWDQSHAAEQEIAIAPLEAPQAAFTVGNEHPLVGDTIRITDTTRGPVDEVVFELIQSAGVAPVTHVLRDSGSARDRSFSITCELAGPLTIRQTARGPGGEDASEQRIEVVSRSTPPLAEFFIEQVGGPGQAEVTFISRCLGTIEVFEFDPGDGNPVQTFQPAETISHVYAAGSYRARIVAVGVAPFPPSTWMSPEIRVAAAWPAWTRNLWWQIPGGLAVAIVIALVGNRWAEQRVVRDMQRLSGMLIVQPVGKPLDQRQFHFEGKSSQETVELDPKSTLRLTCTDHGGMAIEAELFMEGTSFATAALDEGGTARIGNYELNYTS